jgi:Na+/H+ antiporter NhaC
MNGKKKTCHDYHGFKWKKINIYPILIVFLCNLIFFGLLDCDYTHNGKWKVISNQKKLEHGHKVLSKSYNQITLVMMYWPLLFSFSFLKGPPISILTILKNWKFYGYRFDINSFNFKIYTFPNFKYHISTKFHNN